MTEESLFHAALEKQTPAERAAFLEGASVNDPELVAAVQALLIAHEASGTLLNAPNDEASDSETNDFETEARPDLQIAGRYTLQQKIGEGGMGEVWVAKQSEPVKRKVALKLIKTGMDSKAVLRRFEQERQALAVMDHPNIAKVLDAGMTPNGQPFFVMELVNGLPLTKFCDASRLTPRERLELFIPICHAVQHAHQKGIVHRDLKPANILVTMIDAKPVPKVIDFGVAKATGGRLTDDSISTQFGAVVGTLEYMSPEQAGFSGEDIDTRADIYSLGVILYELLTGLRPIDATRLKKAAMSELIRIIQEEEPSKPSTRLSTDASLPSMAALRQTDPRKLMALLRGELDWVVMKCLEKHRDRRYETANALAKDIERYLSDEAVEARPPSTGYRFKKFLHRNRGPVIAATFITLAILGGLGAVIATETRANRNLAAKNQELQEAQTKIQARYDLAVEAIKTFHTGVSEDFLLKEEKFKDLRNRLLKSASDFYRKLSFLLGKETDLASRCALTQANFELAELTSRVGNPDAALAEHRAVLSARQVLADENESTTGVQVDVGRSLNAVAEILERLGNLSEALTTYRQAESLLIGLGDSDPSALSALASCRSLIGQLLFRTKKMREALSVYRQARSDQEKLVNKLGASADLQLELATTIDRIALLLLYCSEVKESAANYRTSLEIRQKLAQEEPGSTKYRCALADGYEGLGLAHIYTTDSSVAEMNLRRAKAINEELLVENPAVTVFRRSASRSHCYLGWLLSDLGHPKEAEVELRAAILIEEKLVEEYPAVVAYRDRLAMSRTYLGRLLTQTGKLSEAEVECRASLAIFEKLAPDNPSDLILTNHVPWALLNLADVARSLGQYDRAKNLYDRTVALTEPTVVENPKDPEYLNKCLSAHWRRALTRRAIGDMAGAQADALRSVELSDRLPTRVIRYQVERACSHAVLAGLAGQTGSGVSVAEGDVEAGRALSWLRCAVTLGYRNVNELRLESALDPLRARPDFQQLMQEVSNPAQAPETTGLPPLIPAQTPQQSPAPSATHPPPR